MRLLQFIKNWTLPLAMLTGAATYLVFHHCTWFDPVRPYAMPTVAWLQPVLIFAMLFLTFCKVNPAELRPRRWHIWGLLTQLGAFALCTVPLILCPDNEWRVILEAALMCLICPTATAAAVVCSKLGGNAGSLTTYTILINIATALSIPLIVPLINAEHATDFWESFFRIIGRIFPLLSCPFMVATLVRRFLPRVHRLTLSCKDLAFYLWAFSLAMAIAVSVRSIVQTHVGVGHMAGIAVASLVACVFQFAVGRALGIHFHDRVAATQALGQKNTVFAIWVAYTFLTPVTSIAGGFYSVWHNAYNSYQLYQMRRAGRTKI